MPLIEEFPKTISKVRGEGLFIGIELKTPLEDKIIVQSLDQGLIVTKVPNSRVIKIIPLLAVEDKHMDAAYDILYNFF
ncbi:aminotransferase class III-fold pyridoxal phosphate-dependent enzyme [Wolbachia endosymbiont of Litomosoides brasiliensis]|uniref:aminotransferase class III-fold pyridoxal phosphate-dependent enzyme n=1 Tax=Wolbachia endosymbiont of Litomosoides brasiliensis TaxID=1812117 RepID=UPI001FEA330F|nr:aminotransferase class III-fold pyridoxal phosphate-dependent enzyme [Wolbachia endosymbiont of Litomosoides brasiliensis]